MQDAYKTSIIPCYIILFYFVFAGLAFSTFLSKFLNYVQFYVYLSFGTSFYYSVNNCYIVYMFTIKIYKQCFLSLRCDTLKAK